MDGLGTDYCKGKLIDFFFRIREKKKLVIAEHREKKGKNHPILPHSVAVRVSASRVKMGNIHEAYLL